MTRHGTGKVRQGFGLILLLLAGAPSGPALADDCCSGGIDFPPPVGYDFQRGGDGSPRGKSVVVVDPSGLDGTARTIAQGLAQVARGGVLLIKPKRESFPYALGPNFERAPVPGYDEAVVITKSVKIRSFDPNAKIVLTPPPGAACITVKPGREKIVELSDFVILQSFSGPSCISVQSGVFTLQNSVVYGAKGAAALDLADTRARIENSFIADSGVGVRINYGYQSSFEIKNNTIAGNGTGLDVRGPVQISVLSNSISGNVGDGIIGTGGDGTYQDNLVSGNGGNGIRLRNGNNFTSIIANDISGNGGAGIRLESGALARIGANRLSNNQGGAFVGLYDGGFGILTSPNIVDGKEYREKRRGGGLFGARRDDGYYATR